MPLSTQVYKWVPANCWGKPDNLRGVTYDGLASRPGEVEILPAASCYRNRDKLRHQWALRPLRLRFYFEEMCIYFSYISADSDLLHSPFEDINVVEVDSDDQQGIDNELKQGSVYVN